MNKNKSDEIKSLKNEIKYLRKLCNISNIPPILLEFKTDWNKGITKKDKQWIDEQIILYMKINKSVIKNWEKYNKS